MRNMYNETNNRTHFDQLSTVRPTSLQLSTTKSNATNIEKLINYLKQSSKYKWKTPQQVLNILTK